MRIAHINFSDMREGISGGVRTLMDAQKDQGEEPVLFSLHKKTQDENVFLLQNPEIPMQSRRSHWKTLILTQRCQGDW